MTLESKTFSTPQGPVDIGLFEAGVQVEENDTTYTLIANTASGLPKVAQLELPERELIVLDEAYFQWCVEAGCNKCQLFEETVCNSLKPEPFSFISDEGASAANMYAEDLSLPEMEYQELQTLLKQKALCNPSIE